MEGVELGESGLVARTLIAEPCCQALPGSFASQPQHNAENRMSSQGP